MIYLQIVCTEWFCILRLKYIGVIEVLLLCDRSVTIVW